MFDLITLTSWSKGEKVNLVCSFFILALRKKNSNFFSPKIFNFFKFKKVKIWGKLLTMVL